MIPASRISWSRLDEYDGPRPSPSERIISVTNLVGPPRIARLTALHRDELPKQGPRIVNGRYETPDTWAVYGTAVHATLERAARAADPPPLLVEHRLAVKVNVDGIEWTLSGKLDVYEADRVLWDWKTTSSYSVSEGRQGKGEWASQLNTLAWLLRREGHPRPVGLAVWGFWKDWSAKQAERDAEYPQDDEGPVPIPLWPDEEQDSYVRERLRLHEAARHSLPLCTPEERWAKDAGWAVMKTRTSTRATALLTTREAAERYLAEVMDGKGVLEERPGKSVRCARYCKVRDFCSQFQSTLDRP